MCTTLDLVSHIVLNIHLILTRSISLFILLQLDFYNILRSLILLVKRMNKTIWDGEGPEFPQVVFDSIKDNPAFSQIILNLDVSEAENSRLLLAFFKEYLQCTRDRPVYGEVLAKMVDFLCEETQHERFKDVRPVTMSWVARVSSPASTETTLTQRTFYFSCCIR
jgi:hypothetical protein